MQVLVLPPNESQSNLVSLLSLEDKSFQGKANKDKLFLYTFTLEKMSKQ
jgi:hypothetical protein